MRPPGSVGSPSPRPVEFALSRMKVLVIDGPIAHADIQGLCRRLVDRLQDGGTDVVICDVGAVENPDVVTVDALARMQLVARRGGSRVYLHRACPELTGLLDLTGLAEVVPCSAELDLEPGWDPEQGKQACGIEEEADPTDTTV